MTTTSSTTTSDTSVVPPAAGPSMKPWRDAPKRCVQRRMFFFSHKVLVEKGQLLFAHADLEKESLRYVRRSMCLFLILFLFLSSFLLTIIIFAFIWHNIDTVYYLFIGSPNKSIFFPAFAPTVSKAGQTTMTVFLFFLSMFLSTARYCVNPRNWSN